LPAVARRCQTPPAALRDDAAIDAAATVFADDIFADIDMQRRCLCRRQMLIWRCHARAAMLMLRHYCLLMRLSPMVIDVYDIIFRHAAYATLRPC